jgi:hypothetical protein
MDTCEDLDSESGSDKDEAGDEANLGVGLVATITLEANVKQIPKMKMRYSLKFSEKNLLIHLKSFSHTLNTKPMS